MKPKNQNRFDRMINGIKKWALKIHGEQVFYLAELADRKPSDITRGPLKDLLSRLVSAKKDIGWGRLNENYKAADKQSKLKKVAELYFRLRLYWASRKIFQILRTFDPDNLKDKTVMDAFTLGYCWGLRRTLDPDSKLLELYLNYYHSKRSSEHRHKENEELLKEAVAYAQNSWEEGDEMWHHQMVKHILNDLEVFQKLNKETLLQKIKPIALEYDRFWNPSQKMKLKNQE